MITFLIESELVNVAKASAERIAACTTSEKLQACSRCASRIRPRRRGRSFGAFGARAAAAGSADADAGAPSPGAGAEAASAPSALDPAAATPSPSRGPPNPTTTGAVSIVAPDWWLPGPGAGPAPPSSASW